jgi:hypothetical protein
MSETIVKAAVRVLTAVSAQRLARAHNGATVCVPAPLMRELAAAVEADYPGFIAHVRAATDVSSRPLK